MDHIKITLAVISWMVASIFTQEDKYLWKRKKILPALFNFFINRDRYLQVLVNSKYIPECNSLGI